MWITSECPVTRAESGCSEILSFTTYLKMEHVALRAETIAV